MRFVFNFAYWFVTIVVLIVMLFYVPVFTLICLGIILTIGVVGGILLSVYRNRRR